jgi:hypothetical protein
MPRIGSELKMPVFERIETVHTLDRVAAVMGLISITTVIIDTVIIYLCFHFSMLKSSNVSVTWHDRCTIIVKADLKNDSLTSGRVTSISRVMEMNT